MKILVTGGAGFVGSHLAERLLGDGHEVIVLDDLSTGSLENLAGCEPNERFRCVVGTVMNRELVDELTADCDLIFHAAAAVGVRLIVDSPVRTIETNVHGTEIVLEAASRGGIRTFVFSTSEVYGKSTRIPFSESDDLVLGATTRSRWAYACSKAIDEFLALAFYGERELPVVVVRLFNTVGPRQTGRYGMVLPTFVRQALRSEPLTVFGDGTQSRCFCHVDDVVEALVRLADTPASDGEVFNIGSDEEITIGDLARRVRDLTGSNSEVVHVSYEDAYGQGFEDMARRVPDLTKIRAAIGYERRHALDDIVRQVAEYEQGRQAGE